MAFEKRIWVDVPDPHAPPADAITLDATELNRLEEGIANALPLDGGVLTDEIYQKDKSDEENRYIQKKYITGLIDYLNNESPITLRRDDSGKFVYSTVLYPEKSLGSGSVTVPAHTQENMFVSQSLSNAYSFEHVRSIDYKVPIYNLTTNITYSIKNGSADWGSIVSATLKIRNSSNEIVWEGYANMYESGGGGTPLTTIPFGDMPSDTYSLDLDFTMTINGGNVNGYVYPKWSIYLNQLKIEHLLRNIITYPQITE